MSKPSRRPNRENRPKKKRDRELRRQIETLPLFVTFYDDEGNGYDFDIDCEGCWARLRGEPRPGSSGLSCEFCVAGVRFDTARR